eukprot:4983595-Prymnesium_polylepis.1
MEGVNKLSTKIESKVEGSASAPSTPTSASGGGGKKTRALESLGRDELLAVARRELEASKKLKADAQAAAALQQAVAALLAEGGGAAVD